MIRVANIAEAPADWRWIAPVYPADGPELDWRFFNGTKRPGLERLPGLHWGRIRAATQMRNLVASGWGDQTVSHGPYTSFYASAFSHPSAVGFRIWRCRSISPICRRRGALP
jgi:hypothetical protein